MIKFVLISIAIILLSWFLIDSVVLGYTYNNFKEVINYLTASSGVVFTILGLWIAYVYPNAVVKVVRPSIDDIFAKEDLERLSRMLLVLSLCLLIIAGSLFFHLGYALLSNTTFYTMHSDIIKQLSVAIIIYMSCMQIVIFYFVIATNINFLNDLITKLNMIKINDKLSK